MGCQQITVDSKFRADNDTPFDVDEETQLIRSLEEFWNPLNTYELTPGFYLMEQVKTHDLATGPSITVYYVDENNSPYGIGYTAKRTEVDMTIEIRSLHRNQLFKLKEEAFRILDYIRKKPFMDYDLILSTGGRRVEPTPGNFFYTIDVKLVRFVKNISSTQWDG